MRTSTKQILRALKSEHTKAAIQSAKEAGKRSITVSIINPNSNPENTGNRQFWYKCDSISPGGYYQEPLDRKFLKAVNQELKNNKELSAELYNIRVAKGFSMGSALLFGVTMGVIGGIPLSLAAAVMADHTPLYRVAPLAAMVLPSLLAGYSYGKFHYANSVRVNIDGETIQKFGIAGHAVSALSRGVQAVKHKLLKPIGSMARNFYDYARREKDNSSEKHHREHPALKMSENRMSEDTTIMRNYYGPSL